MHGGWQGDTGKRVDMIREEIGSREVRDCFQDAGIPVYPGTERALRGIHHALVSLRPQTSRTQQTQTQ